MRLRLRPYSSETSNVFFKSERGATKTRGGQITGRRHRRRRMSERLGAAPPVPAVSPRSPVSLESPTSAIFRSNTESGENKDPLLL
jgi:hypothetical protein